MLLNEVSRQTGVYTQTLRYKAKSLFGRTAGEFTDAEVTAILESLRERTRRIVERNKSLLSENKDNKSLLSENKAQLDNQLIVSIDRLLQFKIPHWKDYDKHLQVLSKLLHEVSKKGAEQYERDLIEAQQLAEEYNQWLDEQLESDYLDGFKSKALVDEEALDGSAQ